MDVTFATAVIATGTTMIGTLITGMFDYIWLIIPVALGLIALGFFTGAFSRLLSWLRGFGRR